MHDKKMKIAWDTFVLDLFFLHKTAVGILIEHLFFKQ